MTQEKKVAEKAKTTASRETLIDLLAERHEISKRSAADMITAVIDGMSDLIKLNGELSISNFGRFAISRRPAFTGHNPRTREPVPVPESSIVVFRSYGKLKSEL